MNDHAKELAKNLVPQKPGAGPTRWRLDHQEAVHNPKAGFEKAIVDILESLAEYADAHRTRYGSAFGLDGVLGDGFEQIASGLLVLLNGEIGRLDCGTIDGAIRKLCKAAKVEGIEQ